MKFVYPTTTVLCRTPGTFHFPWDPSWSPFLCVGRPTFFETVCTLIINPFRERPPFLHHAMHASFDSELSSDVIKWKGPISYDCETDLGSRPVVLKSIMIISCVLDPGPARCKKYVNMQYMINEYQYSCSNIRFFFLLIIDHNGVVFILQYKFPIFFLFPCECFFPENLGRFVMHRPELFDTSQFLEGN